MSRRRDFIKTLAGVGVGFAIGSFMDRLYAQTENIEKAYINKYIGLDTADIIIKRIGEEAIAIKTDTREIIARSTDHAQVLSSVLSKYDGIVVLNGHFKLGKNVEVSKPRGNVRIIGVNAKLEYTGSGYVSSYILLLKDYDEVEVKGQLEIFSKEPTNIHGGISAKNVKKCVFKGLHVHDVNAEGIVPQDFDMAIVENSRIHSIPNGTGILPVARSRASGIAIVKKNYVYDCYGPANGIFFSGTSDYRIHVGIAEGNRIVNVDDAGIEFNYVDLGIAKGNQIGPGTVGPGTGIIVRRETKHFGVEDNYFLGNPSNDDLLGVGIWVANESVEHGKIENNRFIDVAQPLRLEGARLDVVKNYIYRPRQVTHDYAIKIANGDVSLLRNFIYAYQPDGSRMHIVILISWSASKVFIKDNRIEGGNYAIYLDKLQMKRVVIEGNRFYDQGYAVLRSAGTDSRHVTIDEFRFENNFIEGWSGLKVYEQEYTDTHPIIAGNKLVGPSYPTDMDSKKIETDLEFVESTKGVILIDRTTGTKYRLYVDNGSLSIEQV